MSALGQLNPLENPQAWDTVSVSGVQSPGILDAGSAGDWQRKHTFDVKSGKGTVGATVTFTQKPPVEGKMKFLLWTPEHFAAWDDFLPLLKYDPTKATVTAVDIYHPALDAIDVSSVVCTNIGAVVHEGKQLYSISVEFLEYFPPPNTSAVSTPTQATGSPPPPANGGNPPPNAGTAEEQQIAALLKQAQAA